MFTSLPCPPASGNAIGRRRSAIGLSWSAVLLAAIVLSSLWPLPAAVGGDTRPVRTSPVVSEAIRASTRSTTSAEFAPEMVAVMANVAAQDYVVLDIEFNDAQARMAFTRPAASVISTFDRFAAVFVKLQDAEGLLSELEKLPGVAWVDSARIRIPPPTPAPKQTRILAPNPEPIARGGVDKLKNLTGKGVIIAVVDTGLDFRNPAFVTYQNGDKTKPETRLKFFWDTTADARDGELQPKVKYPNGSPIGAIYDRNELTAELRRQEAGILPSPDQNGHGTACAGIAAANQYGPAGGKGIGVAPEADLIAVRVGGKEQWLTNAYLLTSICEWIHEVAGETPAVVSCSFGAATHGRDGFSVKERWLDAFFAKNAHGRAICIAAGNDGERRCHATAELNSKGVAKKLRWQANDKCLIQVYVPGSNPGEVTLKAPAESDVQSYVHGLSQSLVFEVVAPAPGGAGNSELTLAHAAAHGRPIRAEAYIASLGATAAAFSPISASNSHQVTSPGMAGCAITVGSYDFNDLFVTEEGQQPIWIAPGGVNLILGDLSDYSNAGFVLDQTVKPDLVAPGRFFTALTVKGVPTSFPDTNGTLQAFSGTSAATPYVAGLVALLLQNNPKLSSDEIKTRLNKSLANQAKDAPMNLPHKAWGNGKLDITVVHDLLGVGGQ